MTNSVGDPGVFISDTGGAVGSNDVVAPELIDSAYAPEAPEYPLATIVYVPVSASMRLMREL